MAEEFRKRPISLGEHEIIRRGNVTLSAGARQTSGSSVGGAAATAEEEDSFSKLAKPTNVNVETQTLHLGRHGEQFVDVVVCWDAVEGAQEYHVRIRAVDA